MFGESIIVGKKWIILKKNMECTFPVSASEWENGEYEAKNVHIFKKALQNYVVYYVVRGAPRYFLYLGNISNFQNF